MANVPSGERPAMHQVPKLPLFMDRPYLKRLMQETGCTMKEAISLAEKQAARGGDGP